MIKTCTGPCGLPKDVSEFTTNGKSNKGVQRYRSICKVCQNEVAKLYYKNNTDKISEYKSRPEVKEHIKEYAQEYHKEYYTRPEVIERKEDFKENFQKDYLKEYHSRPEVIERDKKWGKDYRSNPEVRQHRREYDKDRYDTNPVIRLNSVMRSSIYRSLNGNKDNMSWKKLVGYTLQELKIHLELKFKDDMTWENAGSYWHIDHIVPVYLFNIQSYHDEAFKKCWSLQNLQPLLAEDNLRKNNIISEEWGNVELAAQLLS